MPTHPDLPLLLGDLQLVDEATVARLYEHFAPRIYRYIYRRVGDIELARDLQNDVFVALLESLRRSPAYQAPLGPWLFRVARDRATSALRSRSRHRLQPLTEHLMVCDGPDVAYAAHAERQAVQRALATLPAAHRQVLLLRFGYNLSVSDAAVQLGRSGPALRSLQYRALQALELALRSQFVQPDEESSR